MLRAVIFDMDGVLVDSYRPHLESWRAAAAEHALRMTERDFARTFGRTSHEIVRALWGESSLTDSDIDRLDRRKEQLYRDIVRESFPAMPGVLPLIDALDEERVALAVGSSGPPENVDLVLAKLGRRTRFRAVVTGRDVRRGKPDPEVFRIASERLGIDPARCVVIEDAPTGIEAAHRAGMKAVALLSTGRGAEQFGKTRPDLVVDSLGELTPGRLRALW